MAKKEISHKDWLKKGQKVFDKDLAKFLDRAKTKGVNMKQVRQFLKAASKAHVLGLKVPKKIMGLGTGLARVATMPMVAAVKLQETPDGKYELFALGAPMGATDISGLLQGLMERMREASEEESPTADKKKENDPTVH